MKTSAGFDGVYCHWDGYLNGVGHTLFHHYSDVEKLAYLLSFGDISSLRSVIDEAHEFLDSEARETSTTFYGRDRGETEGIQRRSFSTELELLRTANGMGCEYVYLHKDDRWLYCSRGSQFFGMSDGTPFSDWESLCFEGVAA